MLSIMSFLVKNGKDLTLTLSKKMCLQYLTRFHHIDETRLMR